MNRKLILPIIAGVVLAVSATSILWSKAHVPIDRVQICDSKGKVKIIKAKKLAKELAKGACRLPACDFGSAFFAGNSCDLIIDADNNGFCDVAGSPPATPVNSAFGVTPACTIPY